MSKELESDLEALQRMLNALTPEERNAAPNKITTVNQLAVVAFALAIEMKAISEYAERRDKALGLPPEA